ncbi:galactokinase [Luedemannella helvata]|uniref:Galactokinase n=1 Tax=Luedemannella helvata TaxID=349315 RepID=A0ABP4VWE9_9ACTN
MTAPEDRARSAFAAEFGAAPDTVWTAPGRVNLIGEHTDYNGGYVLPFALPQRTAVAAGRLDRREWTVWSEVGRAAPVTFAEADLEPGRVTGWAGYLAAVVWALRDTGVDVPGARLTVASDVPVGSGLSSSAALECATLGALLDLAGSELPLDDWPALAQRAENVYVGMPCGIMDQAASSLCRADHALFLDCRSLETEQVPFTIADEGLAVLVVDTRAPHRHTDGEYAARRQTCEAAAARLGVDLLREVADLGQALAALAGDEVAVRRVRHVVTENQRVLDTMTLLRAGRTSEIGPLLTASHASLRDDYEVTVPELDVAVDAALAAGALGARMTGGGFGGCVIALVRTESADAVATAVSSAFAEHGFDVPAAFVAAPGPGAARA